VIRYRSPQAGPGGSPPAAGVLLANLGTPAAPTARALRPYLRQFLSDPRVIELPRLQWWLILNLFVLTTRPRASAALYRKVWTAEGSPLLTISRRQAAGLAERLARRAGEPVPVALGMRYGEPSIAAALRELEAAGCRRVLVLPLYPQYAAATTASTFDAVFAELATWRAVPELRTVATYHAEPGYVEALARSIEELWREGGEPERLLLSYHGMPVRYAAAGDPYPGYCQETSRLLGRRLGFPAERTIVAFQSRFGREPWLQPYTDETLKALPRQGLRAVDAVCPGFAADCLETIEEIDGLNRELFLHAGGERFRYVPCLNDRDDHLDFLAELAMRHLDGWLPEPARAAPRLRLAGEGAAHPEG
jgi:ferrochelatase